MGDYSTRGSPRKAKREHEVRFPDKFWRNTTPLSHTAKGLYATLVTFADYRTGLTYVSNLRLQKETGYGREKIERLLRELESDGWIKRTRQRSRNLYGKRFIRCLRYVTSDALKSSVSAGCSENRGTENQGYIRTPVRSSVTPEVNKSHLCPTQDHPDSEEEKQTIIVSDV